MKNLMLWNIVHAALWALLYAAFVLNLDGALYVLKFYVWAMAPLALLSASDAAIKKVAAELPTSGPLRRTLGVVQSWVILLALIWFGHVATAIAWMLVMLCLLVAREKIRDLRKAATLAPGAQPVA